MSKFHREKKMLKKAGIKRTDKQIREDMIRESKIVCVGSSEKVNVEMKLFVIGIIGEGIEIFVLAENFRQAKNIVSTKKMVNIKDIYVLKSRKAEIGILWENGPIF